MAYVPNNVQWFWAELIEEITVKGDPTNVVHRNIVLIKQSSPENAYNRALEIGREHECSYENPQGLLVHIRFRGIADFDVIHDELDDGAELMFREDIDVPEERIQKWIRPKGELRIFKTDQTSRKNPDYSSKEVAAEVDQILRHK